MPPRVIEVGQRDDQKGEAQRRAPLFLRERLPKFLGYFERLLARDGHLVSPALSYVDLAAFQLIEGLRYAFPKALAAFEPRVPLLFALHERVAGRPGVAAYLSSPRRVPFNERGISATTPSWTWRRIRTPAVPAQRSAANAVAAAAALVAG